MEFLKRINGIVWGAPALVLILGVGVYLSWRTGFVQLRLLPEAIRSFFGQLRQKDENRGVTPFQALCTALAATVGTGNIAGVAGAIAIGGPGAVFWMWVSAVLGMVTKFAEATLAVRYRVEENGEYVGGPMYIISRAMGKKWRPMACLYAFFGIAAAFGVGNATQINAVVTGFNQMLLFFDLTPTHAGNLLLGLVLAIIIGVSLCGGAKRIGRTAEKLVPFAAAAYLLLALAVLIARFQAIPAAFSAIFRGAFTPSAVTGGVVGSAFLTLRTGVARGVFTNEAGMGTAGIAHAGARVSHPARQGLMGIMEVFLDTVVICTATALVILVSGVQIPYGTDPGASLTTSAFCAVCGDWVSVLIAGALSLFAFATVLGWGLYGIRCAQFLFGSGSTRKFALLQSSAVILGAVLNTGTVWLLSETVNGLMAIPNLIALAFCTPELVRLTKEYQKPAQKRAEEVTYAHFHQCKPLRALSHAEVPSPGCGGGKSGQDDIPSEHRSAGHRHASGIL